MDKEKAVPVIRKEEICESDELVTLIHYYCPNCGNKFTFVTRIKYNYCNICGQKLDWTTEADNIA